MHISYFVVSKIVSFLDHFSNWVETTNYSSISYNSIYTDTYMIGKLVVPLGWYPSCLTPPPPRSPSKGDDITNKYPLYKVYIRVD